MKSLALIPVGALLAQAVIAADTAAVKNAGSEFKVPRFSVDYMDRTVGPGTNFYEYADGNWARNNPVPADKARWAAFSELAERNTQLLHSILDDAAKSKDAPHTPRREVGDFYTSAMDTNRIEKLRFKPIAGDLKRVDKIKSVNDLIALVADWHKSGLGTLFRNGVGADAKNSSIYA